MLANHNASLRALAELRGISIGTAANARALRTDAAYRETLAQEFNILTTENELKFGPLCPHPSAYDFGPAEELVSFARANDMRIRGHTLLWHKMNPPWVVEGRYNRHQALDLLHRHIFTTIGHFHGEINAWDVVNEPVDENGGLRDSFWLHAIGPDYIAYSFRWAREADPTARLFINEYGVEGLNEKSAALYNLLKELLDMGVPVDGVGLQMHLALKSTALNGAKNFAAPPPVHELFDNMKRLGDLGLELHITEMDVQIRDLPGIPEERLRKQAEVYREVLSTALRCPHLKAFILWGFTDRHTWLPKHTGCTDAPLLFDECYQPKPAYEAVYQVLETACEKV